MNLTSIFRKDSAIRESSIVDHQWLMDGIVHPGEPHLDLSTVKNPNNIKPQLEIEWGGGGPDIDINEPAGKVLRNVPEDAQEDAGPVILFARDLMNRGLGSTKVVTALRERYGKAILAKSMTGLKELFKMDGVIGRIAVDGRGYASCKDALKAASRSPYKRFIRCVVGCECGEPHMMPSRGSGGFVAANSTGNPMDDFLASSDSGGGCVKMAHCRSTMLPLLAAMGDLDRSDLDSTLVELMNVTGLPQGVKDQAMEVQGTNVAKLAFAFRWLDKAAAKLEQSKYAAKVGNSEFRLKQAQNDVELCGLGMSDIDVDPTNHSLQQEVEVEPVAPTNFGGADNLVGIFDEVELAGKPDQSQVPVEMTDEDNLSELRLEEPKEFVGDIPIDEAAAPLLMPEFVQVGLGDVEEGQFLEPEFEGTDEVVLEDPEEMPDIIDVEMLPGEDDEDEFLASNRK